jgi:hypothetical protein
MIMLKAIGDIIAGLVMVSFPMFTALLVGIPANPMANSIGLPFGADSNNAMMTGFRFGLHMLTSFL